MNVFPHSQPRPRGGFGAWSGECEAFGFGGGTRDSEASGFGAGSSDSGGAGLFLTAGEFLGFVGIGVFLGSPRTGPLLSGGGGFGGVLGQMPKAQVSCQPC